MKKYLWILLLIPLLLFAQDEFQPQATWYPSFFAELLDAEMYSQNIIYISGVGGLIFMQFNEINDPVMISRYDPGNVYKRFYNSKAMGTLAMAAARENSLYLLNISNLSSPTLRTIYQYDTYSYESVDFTNDVAYAAVHADGVEIISIANANSPLHLGTLASLQNAWYVFIWEDHLYVADGPGGLKIYSLTNPQNPQLVATVPLNGYAREVKVVEDRAYVAMGAAGFSIVDVSVPANAQVLSHYQSGFGIVNHLEVANNTVFTAAWELVSAVDVSNPLQPVLVATEDTPIRAMGLAVDSNRVFVTDWGTVSTYLYHNYSEPDIHVKPVSFDFGFRGVNVPVNKEFQIYNLGDTQLQVTNIQATSPVFSANPTSATVAPGSTETVTVTFLPTSQSSYHKKLKFFSNDVDEPEKSLNIYGGIPRPTPGIQAPPFTLPQLNGPSVSLSDYLGKVVILAFFASW